MLAVSTRPGVISLAGRLPSDLFDPPALSEASEAVMRDERRTALQYGGSVGPMALRESSGAIIAGRDAIVDRFHATPSHHPISAF
jgi:hypothetical protein